MDFEPIKDIKKNLQALLTASKDGIPTEELNSEYEKQTGYDINYDKNEHQNLESFLLTLTDVLELKRSGNEIIAVATPNHKTENLKKMINATKSKKRKAPIRKPHTSFVNDRSTNRETTSTNLSSRVYAKRFNNDNVNNTSTMTNGYRRKTTLNNGYRRSTGDSQNERIRYDDFKGHNGKTSSNSVPHNNYSNKQSTFRNHNRNENENGTTKSTNRQPKLNFEIGEDNEQIDYKSELIDYCKKNGLENPRYVTSEHVEKGRVIAYFSKVQIGEKSWIVYPISYKTPEAADNQAAKKALNSIKSKNEIHYLPVEEDNLIEKLINLFKKQDQYDECLFSNAIEDKFLELYQQKLENDWFVQIENSDIFDVQRIQAGKKLILTVALSKAYLNEEMNGSKKDEQDDEKLTNLADLLSNTNLENGSSKILHQNLPERLELVTTDDWQVQVLRATNDNFVYLRLTNNTDKLDELILNLQKFYNEEKKGIEVEDLIMNRVYAAVFDEAVFRVQSMLHEGSKIICWFLDDGIVERIDRSNLRELDEQFLQLPFQSFSVQLDGLENESDSLIRKFIDDKMKENDDALCLIARPTNYDPITVRLYDTSQEDKDIDLNQEIINFIQNSQNTLPGSFKSVPKSILPKLLLDEDDHRVHCSLTVNPNNFTIRSSKLIETDFTKLDEEIQSFYSECDERIDLNPTMIYPGIFVCVKDDADKKWYRARVDEVVTNKLTVNSTDSNVPKCSVHLVDIGKIIIVELRNIQPLYSRFCQLPMFANKASLNSVIPVDNDWDIESVIYFKKLVDQKEFIVKNYEIVNIDLDPYILLDLKDENGISITEIMTTNKKAKYCA